MKIIFMGTPEFAVPTLQALITKHKVVAVYTQAPKPAGRGQKETLSPVHQVALDHNIPVYTPKTLRNDHAKQEFIQIDADLSVVVAYGLILPKEVLEAHKYGCINIHPSKLPFYRGAAPMQRTIEMGEKETAMCIMKMDEGVDTGDIFITEHVKLDENITYAQLSNYMSKLGADMVLKVLDQIDDITLIKQPKDGSYAKKIDKEEGLLDWNQDADVLQRKVRAFNPWPGTYFLNGDEKIKVLEANYLNEQHNYTSGTIVDEKKLLIACKNGFFQPLSLQKPGKKIMGYEEFLRGNKIKL